MHRVELRLAALKMDAANVSRAASPTGSPDVIRNWQRRIAKEDSPGATLKTVEPIARELKVDVAWLGGEGPEDYDDYLLWRGHQPSIHLVRVPKVSWVTAGELADQQGLESFAFDDFPTIQAWDLPTGRYIALTIERDGNSMNKISPPESVIFVNIDERNLVPNACYVIGDERGRVTYKRYRPNENPQFQPASYDQVPPPKLEGAITIIGRVRRSMIDM